jgi:predicted  nucleic acid-binding Zn-ribbon protein
MPLVNPTLIQDEAFQNLFDPDLIEVRYRNAAAALLPQLAALMEARNAIRTQLSTTEARIADLKRQREALLQEIEALRVKASDTAKAGGDPLKMNRQRREKEGQAQDLGRWAADLETAVKDLVAQGKEAQHNLFQAFKTAEAEYHRGIQEEFNTLHENLSRFHASYMPGLRQVHDLIMDSDPRFALASLHSRPENRVAPLKLVRSHTIYQLQKSKEHPLLGGAVLYN